MKVSGFTFVRNVVKYDYPVVESIRSILPVVDEFIVNVGRCDDGTLELIRSISDPKIRIVESIWDEALRKDGHDADEDRIGQRVDKRGSWGAPTPSRRMRLRQATD